MRDNLVWLGSAKEKETYWLSRRISWMTIGPDDGLSMRRVMMNWTRVVVG